MGQPLLFHQTGSNAAYGRMKDPALVMTTRGEAENWVLLKVLGSGVRGGNDIQRHTEITGRAPGR